MFLFGRMVMKNTKRNFGQVILGMEFEKNISYMIGTRLWFKHATPKYSFLLWVAMRDRLSTGSRMAQWNISIDTSCISCQEPMESIGHLYFECPFSKQIWEVLARRVLKEKYTTS